MSFKTWSTGRGLHGKNAPVGSSTSLSWAEELTVPPSLSRRTNVGTPDLILYLLESLVWNTKKNVKWQKCEIIRFKNVHGKNRTEKIVRKKSYWKNRRVWTKPYLCIYEYIPVCTFQRLFKVYVYVWGGGWSRFLCERPPLKSVCYFNTWMPQFPFCKLDLIF